MLRFGWYLFSAMLATALRRAIGKRARPAWNVRQEALSRALDRNGAYLARISIEQARKHQASLVVPPYGKSRVVSQPIRIGEVGAEWFRPREGGSERALLWLHGGGYVFGSIDTHRDLLHRLTLATGCRVLAPNYRLAPEHPCPAALEDALAAYRFLRDEGTPAREIAVGGDSSGGGLAASTLIALRDDREQPRCGVLLSPWVDMARSLDPATSDVPDDTTHWIRAYLGDLDATDRRASPRYANLAGLPPLLVHVGGAEPMLAEVREFAEAVRDAGTPLRFVEWDDMLHVFHALASFFPTATEALDAISRFIEDPAGAVD